MTIFALTVRQPWASLIISGEKKIETRSWATSYRGLMVIHASATYGRREKTATNMPEILSALKRSNIDPFALPLGAVIGTVIVSQVLPTDDLVKVVSDDELCFGNFAPGRVGWIMKNPIRWSMPIECKGKLRLWQWDKNHGPHLGV